MNDLRRNLAPVTDRAWLEIEEEAKRTLVSYLSGRKLVDFKGPMGWDYSSVNIGRYKKPAKAPAAGVESRIREVLPLVELKIPFKLSREELDCIDRGAEDVELGPVADAARKLAHAEDNIIFYGYKEAGIKGICDGSPYRAVTNEAKFTENPLVIAEAMNELKESGVDGPYAIALNPDLYNTLAKTLKGGYAVVRHVQKLIDEGPLIWAPALKGALLVSLRGGDFELVTGRDISIGYDSHTKDEVSLYLEESMTFRSLGPEAAIRLTESR